MFFTFSQIFNILCLSLKVKYSDLTYQKLLFVGVAFCSQI